MQIDCYGFDATSEFFRRKELPAHLVKTVGTTVYIAYSAAETGPVHRIAREADGTIRIMWAYGRWEDAAVLDYVPINETLEVEGVG